VLGDAERCVLLRSDGIIFAGKCGENQLKIKFVQAYTFE
jgi:hypothetical protein